MREASGGAADLGGSGSRVPWLAGPYDNGDPAGATGVYVMRFFFEWGGDCLWAANEAARQRFGYPVDLSKLPIGDELRRDLRQVEEHFQTSYDPSGPGGPSPWTEAEFKDFDRLTDGLLARLRDALGSTFEIRDEHRPSGR